jgi:hypothetical protein
MARRFPPVFSKLDANGRFSVPEFEPLLNSEQARSCSKFITKHCKG